MVNDLLIGRWK